MPKLWHTPQRDVVRTRGPSIVAGAWRCCTCDHINLPEHATCIGRGSGATLCCSTRSTGVPVDGMPRRAPAVNLSETRLAAVAATVRSDESASGGCTQTSGGASGVGSSSSKATRKPSPAKDAEPQLGSPHAKKSGASKKEACRAVLLMDRHKKRKRGPAQKAPLSVAPCLVLGKGWRKFKYARKPYDEGGRSWYLIYVSPDGMRFTSLVRAQAFVNGTGTSCAGASSLPVPRERVQRHSLVKKRWPASRTKLCQGCGWDDVDGMLHCKSRGCRATWHLGCLHSRFPSFYPPHFVPEPGWHCPTCEEISAFDSLIVDGACATQPSDSRHDVPRGSHEDLEDDEDDAGCIRARGAESLVGHAGLKLKIPRIS